MIFIQNIARLTKKFIDLNKDAFLMYRERRNYLRRDPKSWINLPHEVFHEMEPTFVLSTGRCGTKLLTEIFDRVPLVSCYHAPSPELLSYEKLAYERGASEFEAFRLLISGCRFELLADCMVRGRKYVETNQRITFFAPHLYDLFPKARFVHLVRNPAHFVRTGVALKYYEGSYADLGRITPVTGETSEIWEELSIYERCAWLWNETNGFIEQFKANADPSRILTVKSEDMFNNPDEANKILRHCSLPEISSVEIGKFLTRKVNANPNPKRVNEIEKQKETWNETIRPFLTNASLYGYEI